MKGLILLLAIVACASAKYCNLKSCEGKLHTMCTFSEQNKCPNLTFSGLTQEEKNNILHRHNEQRTEFTTGTLDMFNLVWNDELARIAQRWADQCKDEHDECRDTPEKSIKQMIGSTSTTGDVHNIEITSIVNMWYTDLYHFRTTIKKRFPSYTSDINEIMKTFTPISSVKTKELGCGAVRYQKGNRSIVNLVCNYYGPSDNIERQKTCIIDDHSAIPSISKRELWNMLSQEQADLEQAQNQQLLREEKLEQEQRWQEIEKKQKQLNQQYHELQKNLELSKQQHNRQRFDELQTQLQKLKHKEQQQHEQENQKMLQWREEKREKRKKMFLEQQRKRQQLQQQCHECLKYGQEDQRNRL